MVLKKTGFRRGLRDRHEEPLPDFLRLLRAAAQPTSWCLDVGTGAGRIAFLLAPLVRWILGVDKLSRRVEKALEKAVDEEVTNVQFLVADAASIVWEDLSPTGRFDLVSSNLCLNDTIIRQAAGALAENGSLVATCFEAKHWRETGLTIDSAYTEEQLRGVLGLCGLVPKDLLVRTEIVVFESFGQLTDYYLPRRLIDKWRDDGRLERLEAAFRSGKRTLTDSRIVFSAIPG